MIARPAVSSALPGVGIAVALVPPLATIGICLQLREADLAGGALLLFATNLAAIVLSGAVMIFGAGFRPQVADRTSTTAWIGFAAAVALVACRRDPAVGAHPERGRRLAGEPNR